MGREDDIETIRTPGPQHLPVRRRPRLPSFLVMGALVGLVLGALLGYFGPDAPRSSQLQEVILLASLGGLIGLFLAAVAYLVADRMSMRS